MPTLSAMIGFVPKGFQTAAYRCTASTVYLGVEGEGAIGVRDNVLTLRKGDIVVIPGWVPYSINAISDCILFSFSDRVAQEKLGFFREQRL